MKAEKITMTAQDAVRMLESLETHRSYDITVSGEMRPDGLAELAAAIGWRQVSLNLRGCTGVTVVRRGTFAGFRYPLRELRLPAGITKIEGGACGTCPDAAIYIPAGAVDIAPDAFGPCRKFVVDGENPAYKVLQGCLYTADGSLLLAASTAVGHLVLPHSWRGRAARAFGEPDGDCPCALESVDFPPDLAAIPAGAFAGTPLASASLPASLAEIRERAFFGCKNLVSAAIPDGVREVGREAFAGCAALASVRLPEGLERIGPEAFAGCQLLADCQLPSSLAGIGAGAFTGCRSLRRITVPEGVTTLSPRVFQDCAHAAIRIPASVEEVAPYALCNCQRLSVAKKNRHFIVLDRCLYTKDLSACVAADNGVRAVSLPATLLAVEAGAFAGCVRITELAVPPGVEDIGPYAFAGCRRLREAALPASLRAISAGMFSGCRSLASVSIPPGVTEIGAGAFRDCRALEDIALPESLAVLAPEAFAGCEGLAVLSVPPGVTEIGAGAFDGCVQLQILALPPRLKSVGKRAFAGCRKLTDISLPPTVTELGAEAFSGCKNVADFALPDALTSIPEGLLSGCTGLTAITVPPKVREIGAGAFAGCKYVRSVALPPGLASIGGDAFAQCKSLPRLDIPDTVTEIGEFAFEDCLKLRDVALPPGLASIAQGAFHGCVRLARLELPGSVTSIRFTAFERCRNLTLALPASLTELWSGVTTGCKAVTVAEDNGRYCSFGGCLYSKDMAQLICASSALTELVIPDSVRHISNWAFADCTRLQSISLPPQLQSIGWMAFAGCTRLEDVEVPAGVRLIRGGAFNGCRSVRVHPENKWYCAGDGAVYTKDGRRLVSVCGRRAEFAAPETVTALEEYALAGHPLHRLRLPSAEVIRPCAVQARRLTIEVPAQTANDLAALPQDVLLELFPQTACLRLADVATGRLLQDVRL